MKKHVIIWLLFSTVTVLFLIGFGLIAKYGSTYGGKKLIYGLIHSQLLGFKSHQPVLGQTLPASTHTYLPIITCAGPALPPGLALPLKLSENKRYLVDQNNVPFLIAGDSPQGLMSVNPADQVVYFANRKATGINSMWIDLLCSDAAIICPTGKKSYDGTAPFTGTLSDNTTYDLSTPNPAYFAEVDAMLNLAEQNGIVVFLNPAETLGWLTTLVNNGPTTDFNYGVYLGNRYKNFPNIVWLSGNDFADWFNPIYDEAVRAVAEGIKSADPNHLQTVSFYWEGGSLDDPSWAGIINLDSAYIYETNYRQILTDYNKAIMPVYLAEGRYENQVFHGSLNTPYQLRTQEYWVNLSGGAGQLYGNDFMFGFPPNWQNTDWATTTGIIQFKIMNDFFSTGAWYNLTPDQNHTVVTAGYGTFGNSDYVTTARTDDGSLVIAYLSTRRTITVDMSKLSGSSTARWFDPTLGSYYIITGSPFANSGSQQFTPPITNHADGTSDWVLVLETG